MIKYHGTPIGGKSTDAVEILRGRHALVSYAHPSQLSIVTEVCQSFVLDNGAFSEWKKTGGKIDYEGYLNWVHGLYRLPNFDWCLIPDIIDGSEEENRNLTERWVQDAPQINSVPVWHLHESFEYLHWLVKEFKTIAIGSSGQWSSPGSDIWWDRMESVMESICDSDGIPFCKIHGLRMLNPDIFTHLPLSSADSTNAAINNKYTKRFGMYAPPSAGARAAIIASRIEAYNSAPSWGGTQEDLFSV